MKIKPLFILFCVLVLVAQKVIFSDAIYVVSDQYPILVFILPLIILAFPLNLEKPFLLIIAFIIGLTMDVLNDTLGINAFSLVMLAYFRSSILALIQPRKGYSSSVTSFSSYGVGWISTYISLSLIVFTLSYYMVDAFTLVYLKRVLISTVLSTLISLPFGVILFMIFKAGS